MLRFAAFFVATYAEKIAESCLMMQLRGPGQKKRIFYERDAGGFNNLRLQFETLVALAAAFDRELVLPSASAPSHVNGTMFHELDVWSSMALASVIALEVRAVQPGGDVYKISGDDFTGVNLQELPDNRDWFFTSGVSKFQHFECLDLSLQQRQDAAQAVYTGLRYEEWVLEDARKGLKRLGLKPGEFTSVHLRGGDLNADSPWAGTMRSGTKLAKILDEHESLPLLVSSMDGPEDPVFKELVNSSQATQVLRTDTIYLHEGPLTRVVVDMLMLAEGRSFTGTPDSTFSLGIMQLRVQRALDGGRAAPPALWGVPDYHASQGKPPQKCWNRLTTFEFIKGL